MWSLMSESESDAGGCVNNVAGNEAEMDENPRLDL
jgi:hypothetical protein